MGSDSFASIPWEPLGAGSPWEPIDNSPEAQGRSQMAELMKPPTSGFAGVSDNKGLLDQFARESNSGLTDEQMDPSNPAHYGGGLEGARQAGAFKGTAEAGNYVVPMAAAAMIAPEAATVRGAAKLGWEGAKAAALYEGAKALGAPPWLATALGIVSPARAVAKAGAKSIGGAMADAFAERQAALQAEKAAARGVAGAAEAAAAPAAVKAAANPLEDTIQALMKTGQYSSRQQAEQVARAIEAQAGRGAPVLTSPQAVKSAEQIAVDVANAAKQQGVSSAFRTPRIESGAERVGRGVGMTKEQIRQATGPVLNEAPGEASPVLPQKILGDIIDKMKSLPPSEREAYVARAASGKTMVQVENLRRTLEHLGLLLPLGAAAGAAYQSQPRGFSADLASILTGG